MRPSSPHGQPAGTPNGRALVIAGDDASAKATVTKMLDAFGFDTSGSCRRSYPEHPAVFIERVPC